MTKILKVPPWATSEASAADHAGRRARTIDDTTRGDTEQPDGAGVPLVAPEVKITPPNIPLNKKTIWYYPPD